ncbi:hypothetical protein [Zavarzinella formosa]|uniref:hypothetical protein n=1 Tax=Zavarzinella formosa TaxID=360055 RepID=UPI0002FD8FB3|nr:hypothetical protein [Zavarzinella formosa]
MGASFETVFEAKAQPYSECGTDHTALAKVREQLDFFAKENGLVSLLAFESYAPEDIAAPMSDETRAELAPAEWFSPSHGLATVKALQTYLISCPNVLARQSLVIEELSQIATELEAAKRAGVRFRFAIII